MRKKLGLFGLLLFLFLEFAPGMALAARYVDNLDGTVTDNKTKLMWTQKRGRKEITWDEASSHCESSTTGGYSDWRVPRVDELRTIVDYTKHGQAIDWVFQGRLGSYYSSSTYAKRPTYAWSVFFSDGQVDGYHKDYSLSVRCVRTGPYWSFDPSDHLKIQTEHTVKDTFRGYVWQKSDDGHRRTWVDAKTYCNNLDLDGYTGWRLPTIDELQTIINYTVWNPALSTEVMNGRLGFYWSSSTYAKLPTYAWSVFFRNGRVDYTNKDGGMFVRCVHTGPHVTLPSPN